MIGAEEILEQVGNGLVILAVRDDKNNFNADFCWKNLKIAEIIAMLENIKFELLMKDYEQKTSVYKK